MKVDALPRGPLAAAGVTLLGVVGSLIGQEGLLLPVLAAQVLLAVGLFSVLGVPGAELNVPVVVAAAFVGDLAMIVKADEPSLAPLAAVLGPAVAIAILAQLARYQAGARVTASLTTTITALACALLGAALLAARGAAHGQTITVVTLLAAGAATAVLTLPIPPTIADLAAVPTAVALGTLAGQIAGDLDLWQSLCLALAAGVLALAGRRAAAYLAYGAEPSVRPEKPGDSAAGSPAGSSADSSAGRAASRAARRAAARDARRSGEAVLVVGSALPILLAAPTSYVLGRLLVG